MIIFFFILLEYSRILTFFLLNYKLVYEKRVPGFLVPPKGCSITGQPSTHSFIILWLKFLLKVALALICVGEMKWSRTKVFNLLRSARWEWPLYASFSRSIQLSLLSTVSSFSYVVCYVLIFCIWCSMAIYWAIILDLVYI